MRQLDKMLENDLFITGLIKLREQSNGELQLSYEDFDRIARIIMKHGFLRVDLMLEEASFKRLELLKKQGAHASLSEDYRQLVLDSYNKEQEVFDDVSERVLSHLNIDQQVYLENQAYLLNDNEDN